MQGFAERRGLIWASISILSLVLVLLIMASISGGFTGLSGTAESLAYAGIVMVPIVIVVFLALRQPPFAKKKEQTVLAGISARD